jgi:hypothetical protein
VSIRENVLERDEASVRKNAAANERGAISPHAVGTTGVATEGEGAKTAVGMQACGCGWRLVVRGEGRAWAMLAQTAENDKSSRRVEHVT